MGAVVKERKMSDESAERLESRVAKLETNVEHLISQNVEIKSDLRSLRDKFDERFARIDERFSRIDTRFEDVTQRLGNLKVWVLVAVGGGLLSIMARAFHWL